MTWLDLGPDVVAFHNGDLLVVANIGRSPVALPPGAQIRHASGPVDAGLVPSDTTVWAS